MIYKQLRKLRESKGFSCRDMANKLGLANKSSYWKKENGVIKITIDEAKIISEILQTPINDIFFENKVS